MPSLIHNIPPPNGTDDTANINEGLQAVREGDAAIAQLQPTKDVKYRATELNATRIHQGCLRGAGLFATEILPIADGAILLDCTASYAFGLEGFRLGRSAWPVEPRVGILTAQPFGSPESNLLDFDQLFVDGKFSVAAWYNFGVASSTCLRCRFWNYSQVEGVYAAIFCNRNDRRAVPVVSPFTPIYTGTDAPMSDWTFTGCEFHEMQKPPGGGRTQAYPIWLDGATSLRFYGGNISGAGYSLITLTGQVPHLCDCIIFDGVTLYSENGTPAEGILNFAENNQMNVYLRGCYRIGNNNQPPAINQPVSITRDGKVGIVHVS